MDQQMPLGGPNPTPEQQSAQVAQMVQQALLSNAPPPAERPRDDTALLAHMMGLAQASQAGGSIDDWKAGLQAGAPPAYTAGSSYGGYPAIFANNPAAQTGGLFSMADYNKQSGNPYYDNFQPNQGMLSTNNWRLLPPQFRDPNYFMINGQIIDRRQMQEQLSPKSVLGLEGGTGDPGYGPTTEPGVWTHGHNQAGFGASKGYIGSLGGWANIGGEVT